jgi:putative SOS response-associated peptidase YedK
MQDSIIHDMEYYPVSTFVNSVKNNDPNCIKPIDENLRQSLNSNILFV